jgi:hypothetical protein
MKAWVLLVGVCLGACSQSTGGNNSNSQLSSAAPNSPPEATVTPKGTPTGNGPFGIDLSAGPSDLPIDKDGSQPDKGLYILKSVPSPSSSFETYAVVAFDGLGVCEIRAVSADFDGDDLGTQVRGATDQLAQALESKYGEANHTDECGDTCEPQYWSMAMGEGDRVYGYDWNPKQVDATTPRSISLHVGANNITPYIRLDYTFSDEAKCDAALHKSAATSL